MKIYSIDVEDKYQTIVPVDYNSEIHDMLSFNGTSKAEVWKTIEFIVDDPLDSIGNFYSLSYGTAFACDRVAVEAMSEFWNSAGELLPISLKGKELYIFNVTNCIDVLDTEKSLFDFYKDGSRGRILEYVFNEFGYNETSIFKIPETSKIQILTYTGLSSYSNEGNFYNTYRKNGLKGLTFTEVYSDEEVGSVGSG